MSNPPDPYEELRKRNREGNVDPQLQIQQMQQQQLENAGKKLSPEEQKVMQSCQSESFWYRSMPMSFFLSGLAHYGVSNGYLSASARWGSRPKVLLGGIVGYFLGKFSYVNECADKFLIEAPDGHVADMIRVKRGMQPRGNTDTAADVEPEGYGAMAAPRQPSPIYTNPASPTYQGPAVAGDAGQQLSGYEELRRRNREAGAGFTPAYQRQLDPSHSLSSSPNLQSLPPERDPFKPAADGGPYQALSPPVPPVADSAPPSKLRPLPRTGSNKYGDEGFE